MELIILKWILFFVLGYFILYAVVWLHEIGHSVWDYKYGCKDKWFNAVFAILTGIAIYVLNPQNMYISFVLWMFMSLHIAKIFSYLCVYTNEYSK